MFSTKIVKIGQNSGAQNLKKPFFWPILLYFLTTTCTKFHENIHGVSVDIGQSSARIPDFCIEI